MANRGLASRQVTPGQLSTALPGHKEDNNIVVVTQCCITFHTYDLSKSAVHRQAIQDIKSASLMH